MPHISKPFLKSSKNRRQCHLLNHVCHKVSDTMSTHKNPWLESKFVGESKGQHPAPWPSARKPGGSPWGDGIGRSRGRGQVRTPCGEEGGPAGGLGQSQSRADAPGGCGSSAHCSSFFATWSSPPRVCGPTLGVHDLTYRTAQLLKPSHPTRRVRGSVPSG